MQALASGEGISVPQIRVSLLPAGFECRNYHILSSRHPSV